MARRRQRRAEPDIQPDSRGGSTPLDGELEEPDHPEEGTTEDSFPASDPPGNY